MTGRPPVPGGRPASGRGPASTRRPSPAGTTPVRTLFFGSGDFAVPILEALVAMPGVDLVAVVTTPDRPAGRSRRLTATPVARRAVELGLPVLKPAGLRSPEATASIAATRPDLAVLADYGRIVPPAVLAVPGRGFLNLHPSLLPRHRGATPIPGAILAGDAETGVTLFQMDDGLDTGPILARTSWTLGPAETAAEVEAEAARRAAALLRASLPGVLSGALTADPQDDGAATRTRPLRREDGRLDPAESAAALERRVRALAPWPGTFVETPELRLSIARAAVGAATTGDVAGALVADGDGLAIATTDGRLRLLEVQPAGGRAMTGAALRRGHPHLVGQMVVRGPGLEGGRQPVPATPSTVGRRQ